MTITIVTAILAYVLDAVLVGCAYVFAKNRYFPGSSKRIDLGILILVFAFLEVVWIPAVLEMEPTISFANPAVYGIFGIENPIPGEDLFGFDLLSVVVCLFEAMLARTVAYKLVRDGWAAA